MPGTTTASLLDVARTLVPQIQSYAAAIEAERELPRPLFEALADAGMFHMALPRSLGCPEIDLPTYIQVIEELGKADASTAWVINQGGIFATYASRMPHEMARAIWIDTPRSVVANTPAPTAQAVVVPGGYRVTGRQGFSTGCRHASWLAAHAQIIDNGHPRRLDNGEPETRYLFVPVADAERLDTWHVRGMRGTGTHHFAVHDVFVPEDRSALAAGAPLIETGPLYQVPRTLVFASGDASVALGVARAALTTFTELAGAKSPRAMRGLLRDQPMVQADIGHAEANLRAGRAFLTEAVRDLWASRQHHRHDEPGPAGGVAHRRDARHLAGGAGRRHPVQRRRGDLDLRGSSAAACLPGHSRHQPAPAGAPRPLRAGRPLLAGIGERGGALLDVRTPRRSAGNRTGLEEMAWGQKTQRISFMVSTSRL